MKRRGDPLPFTRLLGERGQGKLSNTLAGPWGSASPLLDNGSIVYRVNIPVSTVGTSLR